MKAIREHGKPDVAAAGYCFGIVLILLVACLTLLATALMDKTPPHRCDTTDQRVGYWLVQVQTGTHTERRYNWSTERWERKTVVDYTLVDGEKMSEKQYAIVCLGAKAE